MAESPTLEAATFEVGDPGIGVAFLISSNIAVTCSHVIEDLGVKPEEQVVLKPLNSEVRISATVLRRGWRERSGDDIAFILLSPNSILQSSSLPSPLPLGASTHSDDHEVKTLGIPEINNEEGLRAFLWTWGRGKVEGRVLRPGCKSVAIQLSLRIEKVDHLFLTSTLSAS